MVSMSYEMELHVIENWSQEKGKSYWVQVWGTYLTLEIEIQLEQIIEVLEEISDNKYEKPGFWRRDFFAVCKLTYEQWKTVTEYMETGGEDELEEFEE